MPSSNLHPKPRRSRGYPTTPSTNADSTSVVPYNGDDSTCNQLYSAFMATLAEVNPNDEPLEIQLKIRRILEGYPGQSASQVRVYFVANFSKLREVYNIFKATLTDGERHWVKRSKNMVRCDDRRHQLPKVQEALSNLCKGNTLPDGTKVETICLESCKMLVQILEDANKRGLCIETLLKGLFKDKKYTTRDIAGICKGYFASQGDRHNDGEREGESKGDISADRGNSEADGQSDGSADDNGASLETTAIVDANTTGSDSEHGRGVPQSHSSSPLLPPVNCLESLGSDLGAFGAFGQDADSIGGEYVNKNPDNNDNAIDNLTEPDVSVSSVVPTKRQSHESELTSAAKRSCSRRCHEPPETDGRSVPTVGLCF
ncbi:hypothetical protein LZ30DRAFT_695162 [Colletotrichum cereale]|nr:hypothetical protein LZ30DRAFT_695162 [Colletotrichum cereale]